MQRIIKLYQSAIKYKKLRYGICGLGILGAIIWLTAYNKKNRQITSSLRAFQPKQELQGTIFNTKDKCSLSNIDEVTTLHTTIKLKIDFAQEILFGTVQLKLKALQDITRVLLDLKLLAINRVLVNGAKLNYNLRQPIELGDQLEILTNQSKGQEFVVEIDYQTQVNKNGEQAALNWLQPSQTFGGKSPFLFTQSEPIYARTLYPCQDTPSVKSTFDIVLEVPAPLSAYASGLLKKSETLGNSNVFTFEQPIAIPAYLFAICAGDLVKSQVSARTHVISEPVFVNKCVQEFQDMESYLKEIENYLSPYKWTEYTAVVLPKAFPFGGMENPNLTFLSPSIVVGDKSETSVVIHEMVHSWSGNSMTCQNWECFWLNEGITTFIENKIVGKVFGEQQQKLHALLGNNALQKAVDSYGANHTYTSLSPKIDQQNPDDCFSSIPYMKGFQFLRFLEQQIGEVMFQKFIRLVVEQKTLNADQFKQLFENFLQENAINTFDMKWNEWVVQPGMPQYKLEDTVKAKYEQLSQQLFENLLEPDVFQRLHSNEQCYILDLLGQQNIDQGVIRNLDEDYGLFESKNPEILHRVLIYGIKCGYPGALGYYIGQVSNNLEQFLKTNGRMKFINPVYRVLAEFQKEQGQRLFNMFKSGYHSIAVAQIQKMFLK